MFLLRSKSQQQQPPAMPVYSDSCLVICLMSACLIALSSVRPRCADVCSQFLRAVDLARRVISCNAPSTALTLLPYLSRWMFDRLFHRGRDTWLPWSPRKEGPMGLEAGQPLDTAGQSFGKRHDSNPGVSPHSMFASSYYLQMGLTHLRSLKSSGIKTQLLHGI